ncbi:MAG: hypothetical protein R3301_19735, partial [Saprospiraceae bacterium]|nr:hypothetical protein [Saprospiraceae bacterium]
AVRSLSFFERAPEMFSWIDGPDGLNNYPTRYGVRVLKNGVEVYRAEDIPTTADWTLVEFSFDGFPEFIISDEATFRFELLPYCLIGNDASVTAWDLDEINVVASCASPGSVQRNIFGAVRTTDGEVMPFVEVRQMAPGQPARFDTTDLAGHYAFEDVGPDSISTLTAHQNGDVLNGVSTLDLIRIQQHLLGLRPFDSPYDMIAADVNRSHSVSTSDLLVLRRVLLGVQSGFTNNTSWRFGDAAQELSLGNPWSWREEIVVAEDDALVDFTGIKVGDVTGDATPDFRESAESRSPGTISLLLEQKVQDGHIAYVIRSKELVTLTGLQAIICFGEQILDVQDGFFEMKDRYAVSADGQTLRIVWSDVHGVDLQPGSLLFTIVTSGSAPTAPPRLDARSAIVPEAYSAEGLPVRLTVDHGPPGIGTDPNLTVHPNPMYREAGCSVTFTVTDPSVVSLDLYDIAGHRVFSANGRYPAGRHVITLGPADLPDDQGILICRVQSSSWSRTIPLILLH